MPVTWRETPRQRGAALLVALCVMLVLMILGVSATRTALNAEKSARAERDRLIAFHAAEAALADAEHDIENAASARAALFAPALPAWQTAMLADSGGTVAYGSFTGAVMPVGKGTLPARLPRYIIEPMPYARAGEDAGRSKRHFYRITAIGFGANDLTRVVLQSYYLKANGEDA